MVLYRHFYRQKTSAFAGAGDGLGLRGSYSCLSIVNDRQQPRHYFARVKRAGCKTAQAGCPTRLLGWVRVTRWERCSETHAFGISR